MIPDYISEIIKLDAKKFSNCNRNDFSVPEYSPDLHYLDLTKFNYYTALIKLRHYLKMISDYYFSVVVGANNVDLFMLTPSISSPMGPGSDSEAVPIKFGGLDTYLVDSSQFGFEPLLLNDLNKVYCYLPSMRGEKPDKRHLNQFFHCELEMNGVLDDVKSVVEGYVKSLCEVILAAEEIVSLISVEPDKTIKFLKNIVGVNRKIQDLSFDQAVDILVENKKNDLVNFTKKGRDICSFGEIELLKILKCDAPLWINNFDRDRVPFYQKPDSKDRNKTINADLLFPPILEGSFGGEIVGCGQRQDNADEMYESLRRQGIDCKPYEWYINLRRQDGYQISSGFGLGLERFIAWALGFDDIKKTTIYPRLKGIVTYP